PARSGSIRLSDGTIAAKISATDTPIEVMDALALQQGRLSAALGDKANVNLSVSGDLKNAEAAITADTAGARADLAFRVKDGLLSASRPGSVFASGKAIRALVPAVDASLHGQDAVTIDQLPDVTVEIKSLSAAIPSGSPRVDLRGAAIDLSVKTTPLTGSVVIDPASGPGSWRVDPIDLRVASADLAADTTIRLSTRAAIKDTPAGAVDVDLTASRLLNASGEPSPESVAVRGNVLLRDVATVIAQPLVESMGIDLPKDVGPTLGVAITADASPSADGKQTATAIDARVESRHLNVTASLDLSGGVLRSRDKGISATIATAGSIASRYVSPDSGFSLAPTGAAEVRIPTLTVKLPTEAAPFELAAVTAVYEAAITGMKALPADANAGAIDISSIKAGGTLKPGSTPRIDLRAQLAHERSPFSLTAGLDLDGLLTTQDGTTTLSPANIRPKGSIEARDLPVTLARALPKPKPNPDNVAVASTDTAAAAPLDLAALLAGVVGPSATITINSTPRGEALDMTAAVRSTNLNADIDAGVEDRALDLRKVAAVSTISPATVRSLVEAFAPDLATPPQLEATTRATLLIDPIRIPLAASIFTGFSPDVANAPDATVTIALPDRTLVRGLAVRNEDGTSRDLGSLGLEAFRARATLPPALFAGTQARWSKQASAAIEGRVLSGPQDSLLTLTGEATATVSATANEGKFP
ncbi:MAG TPA: hypothetical protein PKU91_05900, partial [Phycisphaerales bacterium]|nr:hypothetical protein [Phycisphaerales bacterium]